MGLGLGLGLGVVWFGSGDGVEVVTWKSFVLELKLGLGSEGERRD